MKTIKLLSTLLITILTISACQEVKQVVDPPIKTVRGGILSSDSIKSTVISRDTFNAWKARWDMNSTSYFSNNTLEYFRVPIVDLDSIVDNPKINGSRMYMGMRISPKNGLEPHLMVVGTIDGTPDMSLILDYSKPCPKDCPPKK